jgi:GNAT superfamily N-acetyltransferase
MIIRPAVFDDIPTMVALVEARRDVLASYQPVMWGRSHQSAAMSTGWFSSLINQDTTIARMAVDAEGAAGFYIGVIQQPPPVYAPGGTVCLIDDMAVVDGARGDRAGEMLLDAAAKDARAKGAVLMVAISAVADERHNALLRSRNMSPASYWWSQPLK